MPRYVRVTNSSRFSKSLKNALIKNQNELIYEHDSFLFPIIKYMQYFFYLVGGIACLAVFISMWALPDTKLLVDYNGSTYYYALLKNTAWIIGKLWIFGILFVGIGLRGIWSYKKVLKQPNKIMRKNISLSFNKISLDKGYSILALIFVIILFSIAFGIQKIGYMINPSYFQHIEQLNGNNSWCIFTILYYIVVVSISFAAFLSLTMFVFHPKFSAKFLEDIKTASTQIQNNIMPQNGVITPQINNLQQNDSQKNLSNDDKV